jgi:hypothetical protein
MPPSIDCYMILLAEAVERWVLDPGKESRMEFGPIKTA